MELFHRVYDNHGGTRPPLIILHGLFGSSDNWMTQARMMADAFTVHTLDLRNHGLSPHDPSCTYAEMAEDVRQFIKSRNLPPVVLIGHSMGGKVAMTLAVTHPELIAHLIVVDIVPKAYSRHHNHIIEGLQAIPLASLTSRQQADEVLAGFVPDASVRQFLLKNLSRSADQGFTWKINLNVLVQYMDEILSDPVGNRMYSGPCLFIFGERSDYFQMEDEQRLAVVFPNHRTVFLNTGHWVQAEKPEEFVQTVLSFF